MLADLHSADVRRNRLEEAAEFCWGTRLEIENVLMARPTGKMHVDDRLRARRDPRFRFRRIKLWQRQASHSQSRSSQSQRADLQKAPPGNAVTKPLGPSKIDLEHGKAPVGMANFGLAMLGYISSPRWMN